MWNQVNKNLIRKVLSHYLQRGSFPDWVESPDFQMVIDLVAKAISLNPVSFAGQIRKLNYHKELFSEKNYLNLIKQLNDQPLQKFYQNILIAEKFFRFVLKGLLGIAESDIHVLRKRLLMFGIESAFQGDSERFF